jgi:hypothetical protein
MRTTEVVKPLQECAKERETIELYFQRGARRGLNDDCAANLLRWRVSEVDVPMDFVVAYQMAIRGFAIPAVLAFRIMLFASYLRIHCSPSKALGGTTSRLMPIP